MIQKHLYRAAKLLLFRFLQSSKKDTFAEDTIYTCFKNERGKIIATRYLVTMMKRELDDMFYSDFFFDEMKLAKQRLPED